MNRWLARNRVVLINTLLVATAGTIAFVRLRALDFDMSFMVPEIVYDVDVAQSFEARGKRVKLSTFLPVDDMRQEVASEKNRSGDLDLRVRSEDGNRIATWQGTGLTGKRSLHYGYRVRTHAVRYELSPELRLGKPAGDVDPELLQPTDLIQSTASEIATLSESLVPEDGSTAGYVRAAFDKVQSLGYKPFKGSTDALTALRLGEASCNGRSRLFAALMRAQGLPARLVGGLVLERGEKRTSHQWVEVRLGGYWVPMDPTNHHFAELPHDYLALYRGDHVLFKHSSDIGFAYHFRIRHKLVPRQEVEEKKQVLGLWSVFARLGIPLELLKVIIMIPLGGVVIVIFRNVVGLRTFGTFLPALIAASMRHTGALWGLVGFVGIILVVSLLRRAVAKLQLLHSPLLGVLLTTVIGLMLLIATLSAQYDLPRLARVSLFPFAIMAITSERFSIMYEEAGAREAWTTLLRTMLVVFFCHVTMSSLSLQILVLAFPELLLVTVAINIWLGRWVGLRFTEWLRFRTLLARPGAPS